MGKQYEDDEVEIDLKELLLELIDHWVQIVLATILAAVILFGYTYFLVTPQYTSTSILYVLSASTSITSISDIQIGNYLTADYIEVVSGRPVLDQVIENLGLDMDYATLYEKVSLTNPDDSRLLEITVTDEDPQLAKEIADEIAEVSADYISQKMDQDPPSIIQYGYVAEDASSPNIMKNTIIGAMIGFVLAVGIICISYLMNDTILSPEDLEKRVGLNVLASLPMEDESDMDSYDPSKKKKKSGKKKSRTA